MVLVNFSLQLSCFECGNHNSYQFNTELSFFIDHLHCKWHKHNGNSKFDTKALFLDYDIITSRKQRNISD